MLVSDSVSVSVTVLVLLMVTLPDIDYKNGLEKEVVKMVEKNQEVRTKVQKKVVVEVEPEVVGPRIETEELFQEQAVRTQHEQIVANQ